MPNFERDDYSNEGDEGFIGAGAPHQTIDQCAGCLAEIDTTGDPHPKCPCCGSTSMYLPSPLPEFCVRLLRDCAGPRASVMEHICERCLDYVARHDRVARASVFCMCDSCDPRPHPGRRAGLPRIPRSGPAAPRDNPFDTDDWL